LQHLYYDLKNQKESNPDTIYVIASITKTIVGTTLMQLYEKGYFSLSNPDTIYVIASITKTIVGTTLMQLYEKGYFSLDEDVNNYFPFQLRNPNFPDEPITFRMLLSHTSSLNTNTRNEYYWMNFSGDPPFSFFPEPYLEEFLIPGGKYYHEDVWSDTYKPGEHAMYANIGIHWICIILVLILQL